MRRLIMSEEYQVPVEPALNLPSDDKQIVTVRWEVEDDSWNIQCLLNVPAEMWLFNQTFNTSDC